MTKLRVLFISMLVFCIFLLGSSCHTDKGNTKKPAEAGDGTISISGAFALYPMAVRWAEAYMKIHPGVRIDISAGGAGKGITDVLSNMVDIAMVSRSLKDEEKKKGAFGIAVTKDAVVPTINAHNPYLNLIMSKGVTLQKLKLIFLEKNAVTWAELLGNTGIKKVMVYTRSDACGAGEVWAKYLKSDQESLFGIGVFGDPGIANAVKSDEYGIGFNNIVYVYDMHTKKKYEGIEVFPIDVNNNGKIDAEENFYSSITELMQAIKDGRYPSPPARDLYFMTKGKPQKPAVVAFLQWILTDGQQYLDDSGYIALPQETINDELGKLK